MRTQVLKCFKELHKTRKSVFRGDVEKLNHFRAEINAVFSQRKLLTEESKIKEGITEGAEVNAFLLQNVVQCEWKDEETMKINIRPEMLREVDPYQEMPDDYFRKSRRRAKETPCCGGAPK